MMNMNKRTDAPIKRYCMTFGYDIDLKCWIQLKSKIYASVGVPQNQCCTRLQTSFQGTYVAHLAERLSCYCKVAGSNPGWEGPFGTLFLFFCFVYRPRLAEETQKIEANSQLPAGSLKWRGATRDLTFMFCIIANVCACGIIFQFQNAS